MNKIKKPLLVWNNKKIIMKIKKVLDQDLIALTSTDTLPGLLAPLSRRAFDKLNAIKKRHGKPYLILVDSLEKVRLFADINKLSPCQQILLSKCWPGPLTIIMPKLKKIPSWLCSPDGFVALRIPNHDYLRTLVKNYDGLFSTSANMSTQPAPINIKNVDPEIQEQCSIMVEGEAESKTSVKIPSSIIRITQVNYQSKQQIKTSCYTIIRQGAYPVKKVKEIHGQEHCCTI